MIDSVPARMKNRNVAGTSMDVGRAAKHGLARGWLRASLALAVSIGARTECANAQSSAPNTSEATQASRAPDDVVVLRDGVIVRGHVVDQRARSYVNIATETPVPRTIAWEDILSASGPSFPAGFSPQDLTATHTTAVTDGSFLSPAPGRARVMLDATNEPLDVGLWAGNDEDNQIVSRPMCVTPCSLYVPPGEFAFVTAGHNTRRLVTHIDVPTSGLRVHMRSGSTPNPAVWVALPLVAVLFWGGFITLLEANRIDSRAPTPWEIAGGVSMGTGLGLAVIALIVAVRTEHSGLESTAPISSATRSPWRRVAGGFASLRGGGVLSMALTF